MKSLPAGLQAHLDSGATTLCWCWKVTRRDATVLGFTDHDRDLVFDSVTFRAASGYSATEMQSSQGLATDNMDVIGALDSGAIDEADIAAGRYDDASIEIWRVNWSAVSQRVLMRSGFLGEVRRGDVSFTAEVRGLASRLDVERGRIYQFGCDVELGDARCRVDLDQPAYRTDGVIEEIVSPTVFVVAGGPLAFATAWFSRGTIDWTSGANAGATARLRGSTTLAPDTPDAYGWIELWARMPEPVAVGDAFVLRAGCDKQVATCGAKFSNVANYRGFPHMPGNDFAFSYPSQR